MLQCISQVFPEKQNRMCVCVCVCVCRKKIKNTVMLADDCMSQSAGGRGPGDSVAPVWRPAGWRFRKSWYFSLNSKAGKNTTLTPISDRQKGILSYSAFLFYLGLQLIRWGSPMLGRVICFLNQFKCLFELVHSNAHPEPASQTHQNNVWPNICAPYCPVQLTHKNQRSLYKNLYDCLLEVWLPYIVLSAIGYINTVIGRLRCQDIVFVMVTLD